MPNGWNKLGEALAGIHPARREEIRQQTLQGLARTDSSLAKARMDLEKAKHFSQDSLGGYFLDIDSEDPEAVARAKAGIALSGINYNTLEGGSAKLQEQRFLKLRAMRLSKATTDALIMNCGAWHPARSKFRRCPVACCCPTALSPAAGM